MRLALCLLEAERGLVVHMEALGPERWSSRGALFLLTASLVVITAAGKTHRCHHLPGDSEGGEGCINEWTIVTAASATHLCPLLVLGNGLATYWMDWELDPASSGSLAEHHVRPPRLLIYDLGLEQRQLHLLKAHYARAWAAIAPYLDVEVRRFNFEQYPPHVSFSEEHHAGEYAWKPAIVGEVADEARRILQAAPGRVDAYQYKGIVVWMDSGVFAQPFKIRMHELLDRTKEEGFLSAVSSGKGREWNHPDMYAALRLTAKQRRIVDDADNVDASRLFFDLANKEVDVFGSVIEPWRNCSLTQACIAPAGSNRGNHRQDQSVLGTIVALHPAVSAGLLQWWGSGLETQKEGGFLCASAPGMDS